MTEQFVSAAALMATVLGASNYPFVTVDHPISSAPTEELQRRAADAADACVMYLVERTS